MRYIVEYDRPKKKGWAKAEAVFFKIEDATIWEKHVTMCGAKNVIIKIK
jgi:hypothetical protein